MDNKQQKQALVKTTSNNLPAGLLVNDYASYLPSKLNALMVAVKSTEACLEMALAGKVDSIGALIKATNTEQVKALLSLHLVELNMILGLRNPLNEMQIDYVVTEIINNHRLLTMADVYHVLRRAKTGACGELYESITPPKILKWFSDYFNERCEAAQTLQIRKAEVMKNSYIGNEERISPQREDDKDFRKWKLQYEYEKKMKK